MKISNKQSTDALPLNEHNDSINNSPKNPQPSKSPKNPHPSKDWDPLTKLALATAGIIKATALGCLAYMYKSSTDETPAKPVEPVDKDLKKKPLKKITPIIPEPKLTIIPDTPTLNNDVPNNFKELDNPLVKNESEPLSPLPLIVTVTITFLTVFGIGYFISKRKTKGSPQINPIKPADNELTVRKNQTEMLKTEEERPTALKSSKQKEAELLNDQGGHDPAQSVSKPKNDIHITETHKGRGNNQNPSQNTPKFDQKKYADETSSVLKNQTERLKTEKERLDALESSKQKEAELLNAQGGHDPAQSVSEPENDIHTIETHKGRGNNQNPSQNTSKFDQKLKKYEKKLKLQKQKVEQTNQELATYTDSLKNQTERLKTEKERLDALESSKQKEAELLNAQGGHDPAQSVSKSENDNDIAIQKKKIELETQALNISAQKHKHQIEKLKNEAAKLETMENLFKQKKQNEQAFLEAKNLFDTSIRDIEVAKTSFIKDRGNEDKKRNYKDKISQLTKLVVNFDASEHSKIQEIVLDGFFRLLSYSPRQATLLAIQCIDGKGGSSDLVRTFAFSTLIREYQKRNDIPGKEEQLSKSISYHPIAFLKQAIFFAKQCKEKKVDFATGDMRSLDYNTLKDILLTLLQNDLDSAIVFIDLFIDILRKKDISQVHRQFDQFISTQLTDLNPKIQKQYLEAMTTNRQAFNPQEIIKSLAQEERSTVEQKIKEKISKKNQSITDVETKENSGKSDQTDVTSNSLSIWNL